MALLKPSRVWTRKSDIPAQVANVSELRFGGIVLYSDSADQLAIFASTASEAFSDQAERYLALTPKLLRGRLEEAGVSLESRLFSAILGYVLRLGRVDAFTCLSASDVPFRVIVHAGNRATFEHSILTAFDTMRDHGRVEVANLRRILFPNREWGTWSYCTAACARLVYLGYATYMEENAFQLTREVRHAVDSSSWVLSTPNTGRLVGR